jgi:hypothetical protein
MYVYECIHRIYIRMRERERERERDRDKLGDNSRHPQLKGSPVTLCLMLPQSSGPY